MNVIDQIYNGCAMLEISDQSNELGPMERHRLRTARYRINVALGEIPAPLDGNEAAEAYMAGYEDESK